MCGNCKVSFFSLNKGKNLMMKYVKIDYGLVLLALKWVGMVSSELGFNQEIEQFFLVLIVLNIPVFIFCKHNFISIS